MGVGINNELVAAAWNKKIGKKVNDNIFSESRLFEALGSKGFKSAQDSSGPEFEFTIAYAQNPNFGFIAKAGTIPMEVSETFGSATYRPVTHAGTVNITWEDDLSTRGESAKLDYIEEKLNNGKSTAIEQLNQALFGDGSAPNAIDGLAKIISATPNVGVVGTINPAVYPFWRNQQVSGTKTSAAFDNLRAAGETCWDRITLGNEKNAPTHGVTDEATFKGFISILTPNERYIKDGKKQRGANLSFDNDGIMFKSAEMFFDLACTAGYLYFINPEFLKLVYVEGAFLHMRKPVTPANQLLSSYAVGTFAQLCTGERRRLGVVTGIN